MQNVQTCLIEKNQFAREGIKRFLSGTVFNILSEYCCIGDIDKNAVLEYPVLVIVGVDHARELDLYEQLEFLKSVFPNSRVVVMFSPEEMRSAMDFIALNVDGYITRNTSPDAFINYLNLALIGERIFPFSLFYLLKENEIDKANNHGLSEREITIIKYLTLGYSNKVIAQRMLVTEATIKVHLKTVQRKLDVHNRTQVALWAVNNGLSCDIVSEGVHKGYNDNSQRFLELSMV